MKAALAVYISTMFLLHGLAPLPVASFGFMIALATLLIYLVGQGQAGGLRQLAIRLDDSLFVSIFILGLLAIGVNVSSIGTQNFVHSAIWLITWLVCFWWVREWLLISRISFRTISKAAAIGVAMLSASVLLEFVIANLYGKYLSDYIYFSIHNFPSANVLGDILVRPRGFASEAGFTAIVFECLLPISLLWVLEDRTRKIAFWVIVVPAYLLLFSAASLSCLFLTLLVWAALRWGWIRAFSVAVILALVAAALFSAFDDALFVANELVFRKYLEFAPDDITIHADSFSRPEAYELAVKILTNYPAGLGWGAISQHAADHHAILDTPLKGSGLISFPLEIGASAGVTGMLIYLIIIGKKLARLAGRADLAAKSVFFATLWVSLHHTVVLEAWFPMIWFCLALADRIALSGNEPKRLTKGRAIASKAVPSIRNVRCQNS